MFNQLYRINDQDYNLINKHNQHRLIAKETFEAKSMSDFWPISLIHSISKIFSKLLTNRLVPLLNSLVSQESKCFFMKTTQDEDANPLLKA
jgi:hypothetical protein